MEREQFDRLTKHVAKGMVSRRLFLGSAFAGTVVAGFCTLSLDPTEAKRKKKKKEEVKKPTGGQTQRTADVAAAICCQSASFVDRRPTKVAEGIWRFSVKVDQPVNLVSASGGFYFDQRTQLPVTIDYDYNGQGIDYTTVLVPDGITTDYFGTNLYTQLHGYLDGWDGSDLSDGVYSGIVYSSGPLTQVIVNMYAESYVRTGKNTGGTCTTQAPPASSFRFPLDSSSTDYFRFKALYPSDFRTKSWRGTYHPGVDYHVAAGAPVYAVADGVVIRKKKDTAYGNYVLIRHDLVSEGSVYSLYAHLADHTTTPSEGCAVSKGLVIGHEGATGNGSGKITHLHFELRKPSGVDPWNSYPYPVGGTDLAHNIDNFYDPDTFIPAHA
jgi:hypothetical protein